MELLLPDFSHPLIRAYFIAYYGMLGLVVVLTPLDWRKGWPERIMALVFAANPWLQAIAHGAISGPQSETVDWVAAMMDIYLFGSVLLLALTADRWWPYLSAACMIHSLLSHVPRLAYAEWLAGSYIYLNVLFTLMAVVFLLAGSVSAFRKRRSGEEVRDWVPYGKMASAWKSFNSSSLVTAIRESI